MLRSLRSYSGPWAFAGVAVAMLINLMSATALSAAPPQDESPVSFINDVAPILKKNCFGCHNAKKKSGKLDMTTFEKFRTGGRHDDPIEPGRPKDSYLTYVLTASGAAVMPPKEAGKPLPKDQIALISRWIEEGAKLDKGIDTQADLLNELRVRWQPPALLVKYQRPALINAVAFTPDGKHLVTSGYHELLVWTVDTGELKKRIHTRAERAHDMEFLKNGLLAVAGGRPGQEGDVRIYDLKGKATTKNGVAFFDGVNDPSVLVTELVQTDDEVLTVDSSDDGKTLAASGCDRLVRVWDIAGGVKQAKLLDAIENHADWVFDVNFSGNGQYVVTASRDKSAKVWDLKAKESLVTFQGHKEVVYSAVMSPDNKISISTGADNQIRSWRSEPKSKQLGRQVRAFGGHSKAVFKLIEFRKGKDQTLISCSADGSVRVWDGVRGRQLKTLSGFKDWVYTIAISADGSRVAAGGYSGMVRIWNIQDGKEIRAFNASPGYLPLVRKSTR
ncbi:MAG: c-type cytochrome domain-containing protein [Gemmataceae bacterium]